MPNEWYYARAGKREGPVYIDELKRLVQQGQLRPTDHVWQQGTAAWVPASSVEGLFGAEPPPLPPSPPRATNLNTLLRPEGLAGWLHWLDHHKIVICVVTFIVGMSLSFLSSLVTKSDAPKTLFFLIGILPTSVFGIIWAINRQRKEMLHGL